MRRASRWGQWREHVEALPVKAVVIASAALVAFAGTGAAVAYVLQPDRFPVRHVRFEGEFKHVTQQQVIDALGNTVQGNLFRIDLDAIKARMEGLPWVYRASVRRQWPDTVDVHFNEQRFVAQWAGGGWLNVDGALVKLPGSDLPVGLPIIGGPEGTQGHALAEYQTFGQALQPLGLRIAAVELSPRRTWTLQLDGRFSILLGREQPEARLARFVQVYAQTVGTKAEKIKQVDLRYNNGFSVEWLTASSRGPTHEG
jgi:cell division protein FtsQ